MEKRIRLLATYCEHAFYKFLHSCAYYSRFTLMRNLIKHNYALECSLNLCCGSLDDWDWMTSLLCHQPLWHENTLSCRPRPKRPSPLKNKKKKSKQNQGGQNKINLSEIKNTSTLIWQVLCVLLIFTILGFFFFVAL